MKKIGLFLSILFSISFTLNAQSDGTKKDSTIQAPVKAKKTFDRKFQESGTPKWYKEEDLFKASFLYDGTQTHAFFDDRGKIIKTYSEISLRIMPGGIRKHIKSHFKNAKLKSTYHIDYGRHIEFRVLMEETINKKLYQIDLVFDEEGELIEENFPLEYERAVENAKNSDPLFDVNMDEFKEEYEDVLISEKDLPTKAFKYINKEYPSPPYHIKEVWLSSEDNKTIYRVFIKKDGSREQSEIMFNYKGVLIEEE